MKGTFDFIPQIKAKAGEYAVKKRLSPEELRQVNDLKQQKAELQRQIKAIDPSLDTTGKRVAKRNAAMEHLMKLSEMNKELKSVSWMNSEEAAEAQFEKDRQKDEDKQKYKGWAVDASRDISGDGITDVIIYDENGAVRGVNGNTIKKSKYPERQLYTKEYPRTEQRRAMRDPETHEPLNFDVDGNGRSIPGSGNYTSKGKYLKDTLYNISVNRNTGEAQFDHEYADRKIKLTPYKIFTKILLKNFWEYIKREKLIEDIPPYLRSLFFIKLKTNAWDFVKRWVYSRKLEIDYPDDDREKTEIEKSNVFKNALTELLKEIIVEDIDLHYLIQTGILEYTTKQVMEK